ncbi:MAG: GGDEF domain-containing protein [Lachnospiraceae bacterium]|nr:GGDEF domain-containing protein [Lachnospiraceae bacterium]
MKSNGIRLRKLNIVMLIAAVAFSIGLIIAMNMTGKLNNDANKFTQQIIDRKNSSSDLMRASDYLTEQMQVFTVTGNRQYLDNYFTEAKVTRRRENALQVLSQGNTRSDAYLDLSAAMDESVSLMNTEYYAARLTVIAYGLNITDFPEEIQIVQLDVEDLALSQNDPEALKEKAAFMMHGEEYQKSKDKISSNIDKCLQNLDKEMDEKQKDYADRLTRQLVIENILTILIVITMLAMVFITYRLVIRPLKYSVDLIRDEQDLPVSGAYEIRFLAKTYNLMHHTNMQSKEKLTYEATHDKLTGLYNRRGYDFLMENVDLETSALLLFDIDNFKSINDTYGHDAGDRILTRVSDTIFGNFRAQDYICRIGGDELAVIMVHTDTSLASLIESKVKKINKTLSEKDGQDPSVQVSCGVSFGESGINSETIFKRADTCLYEVKDGEKEIISICKPEKKKKKQ